MRFLPSWTSTWSRWKQTVPQWSTCAASSLPSTSHWPPPASVTLTLCALGREKRLSPGWLGWWIWWHETWQQSKMGYAHYKDLFSHLALLSACSSVPSLWPILLVAFGLGSGWGWEGKCAFLPWNLVFPVIHPAEHKNLKPYCSPKGGGSCRKSCVLLLCQEPTPTAKAMGKVNPTHDTCHQGWRQTLTSFWGRGDEGRISPTAAAWGRSSAEQPCWAGCGLLPALCQVVGLPSIWHLGFKIAML